MEHGKKERLPKKQQGRNPSRGYEDRQARYEEDYYMEDAEAIPPEFPRSFGKQGAQRPPRPKKDRVPRKQDRPTREVQVEPAQSQPTSDEEDVDEQVLMAAVPPKPEQKRVDIQVSFTLSTALEQHLSERFPGFNFVTKRATSAADHPITACERLVCEENMTYRLGGMQVIDIGGNPGRHKKNKRVKVHVCNEPSQPKDYVDAKFQELGSLSIAEVCQHNPLKCKCVAAEAFMSVYTLQGTPPAEILKLVHGCSRKMLLLAARNYGDALGYLSKGEVQYIRDEVGIHMQTTGDPHRYLIQDDSWMFNTNFYTDGVNGMAWQVLSTFGDSQIFCFVEAPPKVDVSKQESSPLSILEAMTQNTRGRPLSDPRGPFTKDDLVKSKCAELSLNVATGVSFWNWFIFIDTGSKRRLYAPKGAINAVRLFVAGRDRDALLFTAAITKAKESIKQYEIPDDLMADTIFAVAVTGFYLDVEKEVALLVPKLVQHQTPVQSLKRLLAHQMPEHYLGEYATSAITFALGAMLVSFIVISVKWWRHRRQVQPKPASMPWLMIAALVVGFFYKGRTARRSTYPFWIPKWAISLHQTGTHFYDLVRWYAVDLGDRVMAVPTNPIRYASICNEGRALTPIHESATIQTPLDMHCQPKQGCTLFGVGLANHVPVVSAACVHNEIIAVTNRGLLDRPDEEPELWEAIAPLFDQRTPILECDLVKRGRLQVIPFGPWSRRFPESRRACLHRAREQLRSTNGKPKAMIKGFVKIEKVVGKSHPQALSTVGTVELYDPRLIQGRHDDYQVLTGPVTYSMTKYLAYLWHPHATYGYPVCEDDPRPRTPLVYTSGLNAEELGHLLESHLRRLQGRHGKVVFFEQDASRLDAHCNESALEMKNRIYLRLRVKRRNLNAILQSMHTRGYTRHGVKYTVEATVQSGNGDTSSGDVIICLVPVDYAFKAIRLTDEDYLALGTGDDNASILPESAWPDYVRYAENMWPRLGLKMEMLVMTNHYDLEFCSGRFYPTQDGTVFGPKIGRIIVKSFYSHINYSDAQGPRWLKAVCLGLDRDVAFIPVLRVLVPTILTLLTNRKALVVRLEDRPHAMTRHTVCAGTWEMMEHLYQVSQSSILALEQWLSTAITSVPMVINHPIITRIVEVDAGPITLRRRSQIYPATFAEEWLESLVACAPVYLGHMAFAWDHWEEFVVLCLWAPLVEETFKAKLCNASFRFLFPIMEFWGNVILRGDPYNAQALVNYCLSAGWRHWMWGWLGQTGNYGLALSIVLHGVYNYWTLCARHGHGDHLYPFHIEYVLFLVWGAVSLSGVGNGDRTRFSNYIARGLLSPIGYVLRFTTRAWNRLMHALFGNTTNSRSELIELCSKNKLPVPKYQSEAFGPAHDLTHTATCRLFDVLGNEATLITMSLGTAKTKAGAEESAAANALPELRRFVEGLENKRKESLMRDSVLIGAGEITDVLAANYPWSYVIVDADNITPPRGKLRVSKRTSILLVGVATSLLGWSRSLGGNGVMTLEVGPGPDAADDAIVAHLGYFDPTDTLVLTKDSKLVERVFASGPFAVASEIELAQFNPDLLSREVPQDLCNVLIKFSVVPDALRTMRHRGRFDPSLVWKATL